MKDKTPAQAMHKLPCSPEQEWIGTYLAFKFGSTAKFSSSKRASAI